MTQEENRAKEQQSNDYARRRTKRRFFIIGGFIVLLVVILGIMMNKNESQRNPESEATETTLEKRGIEHYRDGQFAEAIQAYDEAVRQAATDEEKSDLYFYRGLAKFKLKHYQAALYDFREVIHLQSELSSSTTKKWESDNHQWEIEHRQWESANAYYWIGRAKTEMQLYSSAIADFTTAIQEDPDAEMYLWRGYAKLSNKDYTFAASDLTEAIRRNPELAWAYLLRGLCKVRQEKPDAAIYDFGEAIQLDGDYALAYFNRALCFFKMGRKNDAKKDYLIARELAEKQGNTALLKRTMNADW